MRESAQKQSQPSPTPSAPIARSTPASTHPLHDLQRSAGNRAVAGAMIKLPLRGVVHPVAAAMAESGVRFRVPSFERLKAAYTDKDLKIPEAVIKDRVAQLLGRMEYEGKLKSKDPVATIIAKIFPGKGVIDEVEFNKAIDVADRSRIYESVIEADTKVKPADKPKLKTAFGDAAKLVAKVEPDAKGMTEVFGGQAANAKSNYAATRKVLEDLATDMDPHVFTDYNLDDPEVSLGGFANHFLKKMHLLLSVAKVVDPKDTKATLIHEAAHFAKSSIKDHVYYEDAGFFELDEALKVNNAAHYEELPRRDSTMGTSNFAGKTFTPGVTAAGPPQNRDDKIKAAAEDYMRMAWDAAVDTHMFIRKLRKAYLGGNRRPFKDNEAIIIEISKLMDLTVHEQDKANAIVTTLDVTLSESIAGGVSYIKSFVGRVPYPSIAALWLSDDVVRDLLVTGAIAMYGQLLKNPARDKALVDWFESHYQAIPYIP
jgi:hypothetical protein